MAGIFDVTPTTFNRPNDRLPEDLDGQLYQKHVSEHEGDIWLVNHNLKSTNLLVEFWKDSAPYAAWWMVDMIDYDNLVVKWTMPVHGRAVVYAIRDLVGVSLVYEQKVPDVEWVIDHKFGTRDLLVDVWVDGALTVPASSETIDLDTVRLTFDSPVMGKAVLMVIDPKISPYVTVSWDHITDKPATFPPSTTPLAIAEDSEQLGGKQPTYYLNLDQLGEIDKNSFGVAPLEVDSLTKKPVVPVDYLPSRSNMQFKDSHNTFIAQQVYIDDAASPLRMEWIAAEKRVVLSTSFIVTKFRLLNPEPNPSYPDKYVEASKEHLIQLKGGPGLVLRQIDLHTLEIGLAAGVARRFQLPSLPDTFTWDIVDSVFDTPGDCVLQLYTTHLDPTPQQAFSNHVTGTPALNDVFQKVSGDDMMVLNGERLEVKVNFNADHFVYVEHYINNGFVDVDSPTNAIGMWDDSTNGRYVICSISGSNFAFYGLDMTTFVVTPLLTLTSTDAPYPFCLGGANLYMVQPNASGDLELVSATFAALPTTPWVSEDVFTGEPFPSAGVGTLMCRVTGTHLFILNTGFNVISAYSRMTNTKLWDYAPPQTIKDFDVWPDDYMSIAFAGESSLWASDAPATGSTPPAFAKSIDKSMGATRLFAFGFGGATGITPAGKLWRADSSYMTQQTVYEYGEEVLWLRGLYGWTVPKLWAVVTSMVWKDLDITEFDDVRIAFFPGVMGSMPDTLYSWNGLSFDPFPSDQFPAMGQPLSILNTMTLSGGDKLSYALYFKRSANKSFVTGFVDQNFDCTYQFTGMALLEPLSGDGRPGTLPVLYGAGQVSITNNTGTLLEGLKLLAIPMA